MPCFPWNEGSGLNLELGGDQQALRMLSHALALALTATTASQAPGNVSLVDRSGVRGLVAKVMHTQQVQGHLCGDSDQGACDQH